jgi:hypothetical protein
MGRIDRERWKLRKERILIPEKRRPGRIADCQANIDAQKDAKEQLGANEPTGNALWAMLK